MTGHFNRRGGFSLIEALAALAIFGLAIVGIIQGVGGALADWRLAEDKARALTLAENVMEEALFAGELVSGGDGGEFSVPDNRFSWQTEISETAVAGLFEVQARVVWESGHAEHDVTLVTLKAEREKAQFQYVVTR